MVTNHLHLPSELRWCKTQISSVSATPMDTRSQPYVSSSKQASSVLICQDFEAIFIPNRDFVGFDEQKSSSSENEKAVKLAFLGEWWQGIAGRSILKLLPNEQVFYWFESYIAVSFIKAKSGNREIAIDSSCSKSIPALALLVSNDSEHRRSFMAAVGNFFGDNSDGWNAVAIENSGRLPEIEPTLIVVDLDFLNASSDILRCFVRNLHTAYPQAIVFLASNFPRWDEVGCALTEPNTNICGKPYNVAALLQVARIFSSAALPRR